MRISLHALLLISFLILAPSETSSQTPVELAALGENIVNSIQSKKPEWKYEVVSPMPESGNVILQQWSSEDQSVRIAVVSHRSSTDAAGAIQELARRGQRSVFQELGDEDVTWGRGTVSFRRQNLTVNVSAVITKTTVDVAEASKHEPDERKLAKEFARLVAKAIKDQ